MATIRTICVVAALWASAAAQAADAVDTLRAFVREAKSGRASFTQTVTSPDGAKKKTSAGSFEFTRPDHFRFAYTKPYEQLIVGDGHKVWLFDPELNQVSVRAMTQALGATPAALLAGDSMDRDFVLSALPERDGLAWAQATPRNTEGAFQSVRIGFRGRELAAIEIVDNFGQRSRLQFSAVVTNVPLAPERFHFEPPAGAEVLTQ